MTGTPANGRCHRRIRCRWVHWWPCQPRRRCKALGHLHQPGVLAAWADVPKAFIRCCLQAEYRACPQGNDRLTHCATARGRLRDWFRRGRANTNGRMRESQRRTPRPSSQNPSTSSKPICARLPNVVGAIECRNHAGKHARVTHRRAAPELADGTEVWLQELLAHTIGGDRAVAAEIQRTARHRD